MNFGIAIPIFAATVNLSMAVIHLAVGRAPGWRIARLLGSIALIAGFYNTVSIVYGIDNLADPVYLAAARLSYALGTVLCASWVAYAYADPEGSFPTAPAIVRWLIAPVVIAGIIFAATGLEVKPEVQIVEVAWAGVRYHYPLTTQAGNLFGVMLPGLVLLAIYRLAWRRRNGEKHLRWQLVSFGAFLLCAVDEVLVANRVIAFPSLGDIGLVFVILPLSWQTVRRIIDDAQRLDTLSGRLGHEVLSRTQERDHAQLALGEAERHMRDLVESLEAIVWEADAETLEVLFVSEGARKLLGYSPEEWRRTPQFWASHLHPDDRTRALAAQRTALDFRKAISVEYRMMAAGGQIRWFRDSMYPIAGSDGRTRRLRGVMVDTTESRHVHEALLESEGRFRSLFENATVGIYRTTPDGRILMVNPALVRLLGYSSAEALVRRNLEDEDFEPGYSRADFRARIEKEGLVRGLEARWTRQDGSVVFVRESARAVRGSDGKVQFYDGIVEDFTDRRHAEEALRESEERFRNMADTAPVMIWVSSTEKLCTFFNKTWLDFTGRTLEQELGNGWAEGIHPDDLDHCYARYCVSFDARQRVNIEYRLRRADGEYRWMLCCGVPRFEPGGAFAGYIGSDIDITDLKRAQEENFERQKLESLGVLTGGIAHDFNNFLGSILSAAELAVINLAGGSSADEEINLIKSVALRASEIVRELMIYSGQDTAELEPVDVSQLVEEMLELLKISISKHAVLKTDLPKDVPAVLGNATQIRQILMNLIINASEAIGDRDGVIRVSTSRVSDYLRLEVADTGCGMTPDVQARIFDPFFTTKFAGRGLGLAVVQGIVRAHGGTLNLVSSPGHGTTFQVFLPCAIHSAQQHSGAITSASAGQNSGDAGTVLFVEDEDTLRLSVSKMLRKNGYSVIEVADGSTAINLFRARKDEIDVILLDMTIPGSSSREVIAEATRIRPEMKIIVTTAYSRETVMPSLDAHQLTGFIRKPFQVGELVQLLRDTMSS